MQRNERSDEAPPSFTKAAKGWATRDYAALDSLISGRTLKSCPDTCLAVDAESFVTKRIR